MPSSFHSGLQCPNCKTETPAWVYQFTFRGQLVPPSCIDPEETPTFDEEYGVRCRKCDYKADPKSAPYKLTKELTNADPEGDDDDDF
jgi:hypothetical protein